MEMWLSTLKRSDSLGLQWESSWGSVLEMASTSLPLARLPVHPPVDKGVTEPGEGAAAPKIKWTWGDLPWPREVHRPYQEGRAACFS